MRITNLSITNFKAIRRLALNELQETVVIAGPNGCGKSCVFDAIRLLKSAYGGYQPNEWQSGLGEFAINVGRNKSEATRLLQDKARPLQISADFILHREEADYLRANVLEICRDHLWREQSQQQGLPTLSRNSVATNMRTYQPRVEADAAAMATELIEELKKPVLTGVFTIKPDGSFTVERSVPLEVVFSRYDPLNIGIIDYHGANRNYSRQQVDGVNLNIDTSNNHQKQHALYNSANKYSNLKTEMASSFIRQLLIDKAIGSNSSTSLGETLDELFTTFFPGKKFLGPQPTSGGQLLFHVRLPNGAEHDIDELSAGEKEVLYGYLRLRNSTPKNSMILIDEPELHLNPRLVAGLAGFYHKHLSRAMNNQLWLVSHSDTLIREAVGQQGFSVFHMQPVTENEETSQATRVHVGQDTDRLLIDLIGDLAAYRPTAKIVVFEGGGDSDFDVRVVSSLFPAFAAVTNCVSGGNKRRVQQLYEVLEQSRAAGHIPGRFYAITDCDDEFEVPTTGRSAYRWPSYHIENYLLEPAFILKVLQDIGKVSSRISAPSQVHEALKQSAEKTIPSLLRHRLQIHVDRTIQRAVELRVNKSRADVAAAMVDAVGNSLEKLRNQANTSLSNFELFQLAETIESNVKAEIASGEWVRRFRGRDILKAFVAEHGDGLSYEVFRDLILARMRDAEYQPLEMGRVLNLIVEDNVGKTSSLD